MRLSVRAIEETPCLLSAGDLNGDGLIDSADAALVLRMGQGLPLNPSVVEETLGVLYGSQGVIHVSIPETITASPGDTVSVPVQISDAEGLSGCTLVTSFPSSAEGLQFGGIDTGTLTSDFLRKVNSGDRYARVAMASALPLASPNEKQALNGDIASLTFTLDAQVSVGTEFEIRLNAAQFSGAFGEQLDWYTDVVLLDGLLKVVDKTEGEGEGELTPEAIRQALADGLATADTNQDGALSLEEARSILPSLTQEQFDALDTDSNGTLSSEELSGESPTGCFGKSGLSSFDVKGLFGDLLLLGLSLVVLLRTKQAQCAK